MKNLARLHKIDGFFIVFILSVLVTSFSSHLPTNVLTENTHSPIKEFIRNKRGEEFTKKNHFLDIAGQSRLDVEALILKWTNEERRKRQIHPLKINPLLGKLGQTHSINQARVGVMAHDSEKLPKGWQTFGERIKKLRFSGPAAYGENVFWTSAQLPLTASGRSDYTRKVVQAWMSSPGHRRNILNSKFTRMGIGFCDGYITQLFASQDPKN